jgi:hypothetical protein
MCISVQGCCPCAGGVFRVCRGLRGFRASGKHAPEKSQCESQRPNRPIIAPEKPNRKVKRPLLHKFIPGYPWLRRYSSRRLCLPAKLSGGEIFCYCASAGMCCGCAALASLWSAFPSVYGRFLDGTWAVRPADLRMRSKGFATAFQRHQSTMQTYY